MVDDNKATKTTTAIGTYSHRVWIICELRAVSYELGVDNCECEVRVTSCECEFANLNSHFSTCNCQLAARNSNSQLSTCNLHSQLVNSQLATRTHNLHSQLAKYLDPFWIRLLTSTPICLYLHPVYTPTPYQAAFLTIKLSSTYKSKYKWKLFYFWFVRAPFTNQ